MQIMICCWCYSDFIQPYTIISNNKNSNHNRKNTFFYFEILLLHTLQHPTLLLLLYLVFNIITNFKYNTIILYNNIFARQQQEIEIIFNNTVYEF